MGSRSRDDKTQTHLYGLLIGTDDSKARPNIVIYTCKRNEVVAGDLDGVRCSINENLLRTPQETRSLFQSFLFYIQDYDEDPRELYQIEECRSWFQSIDKEFPFLIYFVPCHQYTLYVGSQLGRDGSRLSVSEIWSFFHERDWALRELAQRINVPYQDMTEKLRHAFWDYFHMELKSW